MTAENPFKRLEVADEPGAAKKLPTLGDAQAQEALAGLARLAEKKRSQRREGSPPWHDLERVAPYRDLILVAGFASVVAGVAMLSVPAGLIAMGAGLIYGSWGMSK